MWKPGPLPKDSYFWGGVVPVGSNPKDGFYFADFLGDHVELVGGIVDGKRLEPNEVAWYENSIRLPPTANKVYGQRLG